MGAEPAVRYSGACKKRSLGMTAEKAVPRSEESDAGLLIDCIIITKAFSSQFLRLGLLPMRF